MAWVGLVGAFGVPATCILSDADHSAGTKIMILAREHSQPTIGQRQRNPYCHHFCHQESSTMSVAVPGLHGCYPCCLRAYPNTVDPWHKKDWFGSMGRPRFLRRLLMRIMNPPSPEDLSWGQVHAGEPCLLKIAVRGPCSLFFDRSEHPIRTFKASCARLI